MCCICHVICNCGWVGKWSFFLLVRLYLLLVKFLTALICNLGAPRELGQFLLMTWDPPFSFSCQGCHGASGPICAWRILQCRPLCADSTHKNSTVLSGHGTKMSTAIFSAIVAGNVNTLSIIISRKLTRQFSQFDHSLHERHVIVSWDVALLFKSPSQLYSVESSIY